MPADARGEELGGPLAEVGFQSLEDLLARVHTVRAEMAAELGMAPASVFADHVAIRLAYSHPTTPEALRAAGVRLADTARLVEVMQEAAVAAPPLSTAVQLPAGTYAQKWALATYVAPKNGKQRAWEVSYERFALKGEAPEVIAVSQASGRAIQTLTVVRHLLEALNLVLQHDPDVVRLAQRRLLRPHYLQL